MVFAVNGDDIYPILIVIAFVFFFWLAMKGQREEEEKEEKKEEEARMQRAKAANWNRKEEAKRLQKEKEEAERLLVGFDASSDESYTDSDESNTGLTGIVYILSNEAMPGLVKVGRTGQSVSKRLGELNSTGVPMPFVCHYAAHVKDMAAVELQMHKLLAQHRVSAKREFFKVDAREAHRLLAQFAVGDATFS